MQDLRLPTFAARHYFRNADFYMKNMNVDHVVRKGLGRMFYKNARWLAKNKIVCVLESNDA